MKLPMGIPMIPALVIVGVIGYFYRKRKGGSN